MQRTIVQPPMPGDAALAELKHWLGDQPPRRRRRAGRDCSMPASTICEAFTGKTPLACRRSRKSSPPAAGWQELASRPVREVTGAASLPPTAAARSLPRWRDALEWRIAGAACVQLRAPAGRARGVALQLVVGLADDWEQAARRRCGTASSGSPRITTAHRDARRNQRQCRSACRVTALWRPWRSVRLA